MFIKFLDSVGEITVINLNKLFGWTIYKGKSIRFVENLTTDGASWSLIFQTEEAAQAALAKIEAGIMNGDKIIDI